MSAPRGSILWDELLRPRPELFGDPPRDDEPDDSEDHGEDEEAA